MALLQINHKSNAVKTNLVLNISIPDITEEDPAPYTNVKCFGFCMDSAPTEAHGFVWQR